MIVTLIPSLLVGQTIDCYIRIANKKNIKMGVDISLKVRMINPENQKSKELNWNVQCFFRNF